MNHADVVSARVRARLTVAAAAAVVGCTASLALSPARASTITWQGTAGGMDWAPPAHWSPTGPPAAGDTAVLGNTGIGTIDLGGVARQIDTLKVSNSNFGQYSFSNGSFVLNNIAVTTSAGASIPVPVAAAGPDLTLQNASNAQFLTLSGSITTQNLTVGGQSVRLSGTNTFTGTVTANGG